MAEKIDSLKDIKTSAAASAEVRKPKRDKQGRSYATGKRKDAVARVWIKPGKGNITINEKSIDQYFARPVLKMIINQPFEVSNREMNLMLSAPLKAADCPVRPALSNTVSLKL